MLDYDAHLNKLTERVQNIRANVCLPTLTGDVLGHQSSVLRV